ncbi:MAG: hypothetical protein RR657_04390 [Peptostreptococcaceae bacterium]
MMRKDIQSRIHFYLREEKFMINKSELARRLNCDPRTIDRYFKIETDQLIAQKSKRVYDSVLDDYKSIIIDKVDTYGVTVFQLSNLLRKKVIEVSILLLLLLLKVIRIMRLTRLLLDLKPLRVYRLKLIGKKN